MTSSPANLERVARKGSHRRRRRVLRWIKRGVLVLAGLGIVAAIIAALLPSPIEVDIAVASRGPLEVEIREDGQTRVRDRFVISAPISGELERITLDAGAEVSTDTVVARIRAPRSPLLDARARSEAVAQLSAAKARERQAVTAVARAKATRDQAVRDANRTRTLAEHGAVTGRDRERAELAEQLANDDLASAQLQRRAAAAEIRALEATLRPTPTPHEPVEVTAPVAGKVLRVERESAGFVTAGTPLLEIGDPSDLEVVIDVLSRDAERIAPGMAVELTTSAAQPVRGAVRSIEPSAFTRVSALGVEEQRVNVIAAIEPGPARLGDAYRVDARIIVWRGDQVLRIPASALFRQGGGWAVYVIEDERARARPVTLGHRGRLDVEITRGLAPGEHVIVHPDDRIRDGSRVEPRS